MSNGAPESANPFDGDDAFAESSAWRISFFPALVLLGIGLPLIFATWVERYLYYLRPLELIPTYGTAWLLLAVLVAPFPVIFGFALCTLNPSRNLWSVRGGLIVILVGVAGATLVAPLVSGAIIWAGTFGLLVPGHFHAAVVMLSIPVGALLGISASGRAALLRLYWLAKYGAAVGAISLLSLPFSGWGAVAPAPRAEAPALATAPPSRPHILLITIDSLSAEHMSLYGATRQTTPNLETFARSATTFDRAYANGNFTTAGISSILTATRPWAHRAFQAASWPVADARLGSLPALLRQTGYQTAYVATNPLAGAARIGLGSYFKPVGSDRAATLSLCRDALTLVLPYECAAAELPPFVLLGRLWDEIRRITVEKPPNGYYDPRAAIQPALQWLANTDKRVPIFLWVHLLPPHAPYAAPAPWLGQFDSSPTARDAADSTSQGGYLFGQVTKEQARVLEARYDESVKYVDHYVGQFVGEATQLLGDNTAFVITADHGESFEHGYGEHGGPGLFESITHIPLVIKIPYQARGARTSVLAEQVDIAPTVAELAGITPPRSWEGRSLLEVWRPSQAGTREASKSAFSMSFEENPRYSALNTGSVAVIDGRWKLVHFMGALHYPSMPPLHDELYDLSSDPRELSNRITDQPHEAAHLRTLIDSQLRRQGGALP